jgi:hypothetical protein
VKSSMVQACLIRATKSRRNLPKFIVLAICFTLGALGLVAFLRY